MNRQALLAIARRTADGAIISAIEECLNDGICVLVAAKRAGDAVLLEYQRKYGEEKVQHVMGGWVMISYPDSRQQYKHSMEEAVQKTAEILRQDSSALTPKWSRELGLIRFMNTVWPTLPDAEKMEMREAARKLWKQQQ
jgi:hypothetical protein